MQEQQNMQTQPMQIDELAHIYIPSSQEKKKAIMMYMFVGVMLMMFRKKASIFEYIHLKQAIGRRVVFLMTLVVLVIFMFLPYVRYIALIPFLVLIVLRFVFVKIAWDGKYKNFAENSPLGLFMGIGDWVLGLFDMIPEVEEEQPISISSNVPPQPTPQG